MWSKIVFSLYLQLLFIICDLKSMDILKIFEDLYLHILDISLTASMVILAVMLVRLCLRRVPRIYSYALWSIVLIRLLCPVFPVSDVGVIPVIDSVWEEYSLSDDVYTVATELMGRHDVSDPSVVNGWELGVLFFRFLWPVGMAVMIIYSQFHYRRVKKGLMDSAEIGKRVYLSDHISTPFVMGLLRPKIYLPSLLGKRERTCILYHELHHISRRDYVIKMVAYILLCVHWFNPFVWLAFVLMNRDMEMSCDEAVISELERDLGGDVRADYSSLLLELSIGERMVSGTPLAFGESDIRGRILNLVRWKRPNDLKQLYAGLVIIAAGFCLLTNADRAAWSAIASKRETGPFGQVWEVKKIIYGDETMDDYRDALFWISEEGYLIVSDDRMPINEGEDGIKFAAFSLSHELFDELFVDNEAFWATGRNLSRSIRHRNAGAWRILVEQSDRGPMLYYLLEQANGKVYLLMGRYDKENLGDWFDDTSRFWWMCELQRIENERYLEKEDNHE